MVRLEGGGGERREGDRAPLSLPPPAPPQCLRIPKELRESTLGQSLLFLSLSHFRSLSHSVFLCLSLTHSITLSSSFFSLSLFVFLSVSLSLSLSASIYFSSSLPLCLPLSVSPSSLSHFSWTWVRLLAFCRKPSDTGSFLAAIATLRRLWQKW